MFWNKTTAENLNAMMIAVIKSRVLRTISLMLIVVLFCPFAHAKLIHVDDDGQADFDNIQAAIDVANDGDTVLVGPAKYLSTVPITFRGKAIMVRSEAGPEGTTIRMSDSPSDPDSASVVIFEGGEIETSVLDGFTISGGQGCWSDPFPGTFCQGGGGIFCRDSSPTIANCIISENRTLSQNEAPTVGGGVLLANSSAVMTRCTICSNSTTYWGGGMYIFNGSPLLTDCAISRNVVHHQDGQGGGLIMSSLTDSKPLLLRCTISGNSAPHSAGGIQVSAYSQPTLRDCLISDNISFGGNGGILCSWWSATTLTNCTIARNSCVRIGGGVGCGHSAEAIVTNCTITENVAGRHSGGVSSYDNSSITLRNCIVFGNTAPTGPEIGLDYGYYHTPTSMNISYCDIGGGMSAAHIGQGTTLNWDTSNIDVDPLFADPNNGDFHLKSQAGRWHPNSQSWIQDNVTSLCIDAGDADSDWTCELWPHGKRINLGAYGGTSQSSMSLSDGGSVADFNSDDVVDWQDLRRLGDVWLAEAVLLAEDISRDGLLDFSDFAELAKNWLRQQP